ncbi:MAG: glucose-6-phosphate isomerase, partial [Pirellulaceae bacterium]
MSLIELATDGVFIPQRGLQKEELSALDGRLAEIRDSIYERDLSEFAAGTASDERLPLDTAFVDLPDRLLHTYKSDRDQSVLNDVLVVARRLSELVDRVVVLGIGGSYMGARALMESLCHPYFNELSRGQRGGYPRLYFEGNNVDNDALQGLLDLLLQGNEWQHVE